MSEIRVKILREGAKLPAYGTSGAAGADLYACTKEPICIAPHETAFVPTGLSMEIPAGCAGLIYARSGLACKQGLAPANKVGVIDSDYRGEILVALHNHGAEIRVVNHGDRIAQMVITPVLTPAYTVSESLSDTARDGGGFGSTGK